MVGGCSDFSKQENFYKRIFKEWKRRKKRVFGIIMGKFSCTHLKRDFLEIFIKLELGKKRWT